MAATSIGYGVCVPINSPHPRTRFKTHNISSKNYHSLSSKSSSSSLPSKFLLPRLQTNVLRHHKSHVRPPPIFALQSNFFKVVQTALKIGKDGVEAGTNLVPDAVPRPVAKLSVTVLATVVSLFVLRSFVSTVFFALGFMGFVYFVYLALSKGKGPKMDEKPGSTDEAIDQANKIMDKYK